MNQDDYHIRRGPLGRVSTLPAYTVDSLRDGIELGKLPRSLYTDRRGTALMLEGEGTRNGLRLRHAFRSIRSLADLESTLRSISARGGLAQSIFYLGAAADPFLPFDHAFDATRGFLKLFCRYRPGLLVIQTRSPLVVITLSLLKELGSHVAVRIGIETPHEGAVQRYTPGLPPARERLNAARALQRFGIAVQLSVEPVLPYGDWERDARRFASLLCERDFPLRVGSLASYGDDPALLIRSPVRRRLALENKWEWLRADSDRPLLEAIRDRAPELLRLPALPQLEERQRDLFA